jgi:hypothetical protein
MKPYVTDIMVGNNETTAGVSKGQYKGIFLQKDDATFDIVLQDVLNIPKLMMNMFSLAKATEHTGDSLSSKVQNISLTVGTTEMYFDKVCNHGSERLLGISNSKSHCFYCSDLGHYCCT